MVQSGDDYREKNKIRLNRFYERQKKQGKKRLSALVTDKAYELLMVHKKQTGHSMSTLVDRAVMLAYGCQSISDIDTALNESKNAPSADTGIDEPIEFITMNKPDTDSVDLVESTGENQADNQGKHETKERESDTATDDQGPEIIPDCKGKTIDIEERDRYLVAVSDALPGRKHAKDRVNLLNRKGIPVSLKTGHYGGQWDKKKFSDNLRFAKKRLGIK